MSGSYRFGLVLLLVFATMLVGQTSGGQGIAFATIALQYSVTCATAWIAGLRPVMVGIAIGTSLIILATALISTGFEGDSSEGILNGGILLLSCLSLAMVSMGVLRQIVDRRTITIPTVLGALAIYLLLGLLFAALYSTIQSLESTSFFIDRVDGNFSDNVYFSFVTLTSVGYGDFAPATYLGHRFTVIEALIGQIYMVTVVALFVSNLARSKRLQSS